MTVQSPDEVERALARLEELASEDATLLPIAQIMHALLGVEEPLDPQPGSGAALTLLAEQLAARPASRRALETLLSRSADLEAAAHRRPPLSARERELLAEQGIDVDELAPSADVTATETRTAAAVAAMAHNSLSTKEAAEQLGLSDSRVRQLVAERRLVALSTGRRLLLPTWQFTDEGRPLPGLEAVLAALGDRHPLAIQQALHTTDVDLLDDDGNALSPLEWLRAGYDPGQVVAQLNAAESAAS